MSEHAFDTEETHYTASIRHQVIILPPFIFSLQSNTTHSDSPAVLTQHCIRCDGMRQCRFCFLSLRCQKRHEVANASCYFFCYCYVFFCFFLTGSLLQTPVIKWIARHKASSKLELLLCRWILPELCVDGCCSRGGTINSGVIIIDFPQVIIICPILDIWGFNAASQMAFWLIGTMLRAGNNTEAVLKRSVVSMLCQEKPFFITCPQI